MFSRNDNKFSDLFLKIYASVFLIIIFYTLYRIILFYLEGVDIEIIFDKYFKYLIISTIFILFFLVSLKLNNNIKQNIVLIFTSTTIILYVIEFFLALYFPELRDNEIRKINQVKKIEKYNNFINKNIFPFEVIKKEFNFNDKKIFPLTYIPNVNTFLCNETGKDIFYQSDKHGFRNENSQWENKKVDILLIGDSFVHGACEENDKTIASFLKQNGKNVINLGMGGAGPLKEFAIFREYAQFVKPQNVVWFFSEGTDLTKDLRGEKKNKILIKYFKEEYSQNLINDYIYLKPLLEDHIKKRISNKSNEKKEPRRTKTNKIISHYLDKTKPLRLWNLRKLTSSFTKVEIKKIDPLFFEILQKVDLEVKKWNGKLFFVYMPEARRYDNNLNRFILKGRFRGKDYILENMNKLNIDIIDVDKEIFSNEIDPLKFFNEINVHYNEKGYKSIAFEIIDKLQN